MNDITKDAENVVKETNRLIEWAQGQIPNLISLAITIVIALVVFFIGKKVIKLLLKLLKKNFERMKMEDGVIRFLLSLLKVLLYLLLIIVVAQILGLETSSVIALVGSAGLAVGLALQGSLANLAGGVLILVSKPFVMGDYIIYGDKEGTVVGIDIIYTKLLTPDNRKVTLPNGDLANSDIINVTSEDVRRLDLSVSIDYSEDIKKVKDILEKLLTGHDMILPDQDISIFVNSFDPSSINIGYRVWTKTEDYWALRCQLMEEVKMAFDENEIVIPFDQLDVQIKNQE